MNTCGLCKHGHSVPGALQVRLCKGGPPTPIYRQVGHGVELAAAWPHVSVNDAACGAFKPKVIFPDTPFVAPTVGPAEQA